MQATETRTLGQFGTVEEAYSPKSGRPYRHSQAPKLRGTPEGIRCVPPTAEARAKRAEIEKQQSANLKAKRKHGGRARWIEYIGKTRDDLYGLKVKVTGCKAETYWLPYSQAAVLWYEISGEGERRGSQIAVAGFQHYIT